MDDRKGQNSTEETPKSSAEGSQLTSSGVIDATASANAKSNEKKTLEAKSPSTANADENLDMKHTSTEEPEVETEEPEVEIPITVHKPTAADDEIPIIVDKAATPTAKNDEIPIIVNKAATPAAKKLADELRVKGNKAFAANKYEEAIACYSQGLASDPQNHLLYSNRSLAQFKLAKSILSEGVKEKEASEGVPPARAMGLYVGSLEDALHCIEIEPNFRKAYHRAGEALTAMGRTDAAIRMYEASLQRFPNDKALKADLQAAIALANHACDQYPLFHTLLRNVDPSKVWKKKEDQKQKEEEKMREPTVRGRGLEELFGPQYTVSLVKQPESRWTYFFGEPPNTRSIADWEPERETEGVWMKAPAQDDWSPQHPSPPQYASYHQHYPHPYPRPSHTENPDHKRPAPFHREYEYEHPQKKRVPSPSPDTDTEPTWWRQPYQSPYYPNRPRPRRQRPRAPPQTQTQPQQWHEENAKAQRQWSQEKASHLSGRMPSQELVEVCKQLRCTQYLGTLVEQGVETVEDLLILSEDAIKRIVTTLGHQARFLDWRRRAKEQREAPTTEEYSFRPFTVPPAPSPFVGAGPAFARPSPSAAPSPYSGPYYDHRPVYHHHAHPASTTPTW